MSEREALARVLYEALGVWTAESPRPRASWSAASAYWRDLMLVQADAVLAAGWVRNGLEIGGDRG